MSKNRNVNVMLEQVEAVFDGIHNAVMSMELGERIQTKDLVTIVSQELNVDPGYVTDFVDFFMHNEVINDICHVRRGKKGGIIRGPKPEGKKVDVSDDIDLDATGTDD